MFGCAGSSSRSPFDRLLACLQSNQAKGTCVSGNNPPPVAAGTSSSAVALTPAPTLAQTVVSGGSRRLVAAHTAAAPPAPTKRVLQAGGTTVLRHPGTAGFCTGHGVQVARLGSPNQTRAPFQNVQCALGLPARALQLAPLCFRTVCIETRAGPPRSVVADAQNMTTRFPDRCEQVRTHF